MSFISSPSLELFDREYALHEKLMRLGVNIFQGDTTPVIREERARRAILDTELESVVALRSSDGRSKTFSELFQWVYGQAVRPVSTTQGETA